MSIYKKLFSVPEKPKHVNTNAEMAAAMRRGTEQIALTRAALARDPASSANRRVAQREAQRKNEPAIDLLKAGACRAFNPIAQKH
jgi:hypothetical protein